MGVSRSLKCQLTEDGQLGEYSLRSQVVCDLRRDHDRLAERRGYRWRTQEGEVPVHRPVVLVGTCVVRRKASTSIGNFWSTSTQTSTLWIVVTCTFPRITDLHLAGLRNGQADGKEADAMHFRGNICAKSTVHQYGLSMLIVFTTVLCDKLVYRATPLARLG